MGNDRIRRRDFVSGGTAAGFAAAAGAPVAKAASISNSTPMSHGEIAGLKISRLILGSNPLGGGAHSRDLIYVSRLLREYNTEERILKTFEIAEQQGINTVLQGHSRLIRKHNSQRGGRLRQIRPLKLPHDSAADVEETKLAINQAMTEDTAALYVFGDTGDYLARNSRIENIGVALEVARSMGVVLGVGGHSLEVVTKCEQQKLAPAFYVKTFHNDNYWSATPKPNREPYCWYDGEGGNSYSGRTGDHDRFHDNIWCLDPAETTRVMSETKVPWIAFKVLAAGAIHPKEAFDFAFRNGADFVAVGMLDYQLTEDAQITNDCVAKCTTRRRPWRA